MKTRDYLEAVRLASELAIRIQQISVPTVDDIKSIYSDFSGAKKKQSQLLKDIDVASFLCDLSVKSQAEYRSCWTGFVECLSQSMTLDSIRQVHIETWKSTQTCSVTTMRKKLRLLSSCLGKVGHDVEPKWFKMTVDKKAEKARRAITKVELKSVLQATERFKDSKDEWKYYLPRIGALTGARLNEIAQLRVCDIDLGKQPTLSINDNHPDKKLKNAASKREVSVSDELKLILTELIASKGSDEFLFNLPYSKFNGYVGKPSKYFSLLFKSLGINGVSFHSLRHYVITELFNRGVKEELIGSPMGHSVGKLTTGKIYLSGFNYQIKFSAIEMMTLAFSS